MISIQGKSPNLAYKELLKIATQQNFAPVPSRIGDFIDLGHVFVEFDHGERLVLLEGRNINPIFALVETAWLIAGRNDLAPLRSILKNYANYSDDGITLAGAYGHRLRSHFGKDQISGAVNELKINPTSRRVVLTMFSADDLGKDSKDIPCNTQVILRIEAGRLGMTVINRSNDLWLGVPYNWFAFRGLQEFVAKELEIPAGIQRHFSTCMHLYVAQAAAAKNVVERNSSESIEKMERSFIPFEMSNLLDDISPLSVSDLSALRTPALRRCAMMYRKYVDKNEKWNNVNIGETPTSLDISLSMWIANMTARRRLT